MRVVRLPSALPRRSGSRPTHVPLGDAAAVRHRDDAKTTELNAAGGPHAQTVELTTTRRRGFWRELSGSLAAGVVVLAVVVLVMQVVSWIRNVPGLGGWVLAGHVVGAVLAVLAQRQVDRRTGRGALVAGLVLGAVAAGVLALFWWS